MKLNEWNEIREEETGQALAAWRADPDNEEKARDAMATLAGFQARDSFMNITTEIAPRFRNDPETLKVMGSIAEEFSLLEQARSVYQRVTELQPENRDAREDLARILIRQRKPAEAEPYLTHVLQHNIPDRIGLVVYLAEAYQAQGDHHSALRLLDEIEMIAPEIKREKALRRARKLSLKHRATGRPVVSPRLKEAEPVAANAPDRGGAIARFAFPVLALLALMIYALVAWMAGRSHDVWVVNGLNEPYTALINGRTVALDPGAPTRVQLAEGTFVVEFEDENLGFNPAEAFIETPFWRRPVLNRTWILNPDRLAIVTHEIGYYVPESRPFIEDDIIHHPGRVLHQFDGIDFVFEDFPPEINVSVDDVVTRERVDIVPPDFPILQTTALTHISQTGDAGAAIDMGMKLAHRYPDDHTYLWALEMMMEEQEYVAFLREGLDQRPLLVHWHRKYQDVLDRHGRNEEVQVQYTRMLKENPDLPELIYLAGRAQTDPVKNQTLMARAAAMEDASAQVLNGHLYGLWSTGRFEQAVPFVHRAMELRGDDVNLLLSLDLQMLHAAGRCDEAIALLDRVDRQMLSMHGESLGLEGDYERLELLCTMEDAEQIDALMAAMRNKVNSQSVDHAERDRVLRYIQGLRAYYERRLDEAATLWSAEDFPWEHALLTGDLAAAESTLQEWEAVEGQADPGLNLVIALAAVEAGDPDMANRRRKVAADALAEGRYEERKLADALRGQPSVPPRELVLMSLRPEIKLPGLSLLGWRDPVHRETYWSMARRLNYDLDFPRHLYDAVLGD